MKSNTAIQMDKRSILNRMRKVAAGYLGVKKNESLDSVVSLFIESLGEEIYKLAGEVDTIESRLSETLQNMLNPDISISSFPAHCILHASPEEAESVLTKETCFTTEGKKTAPLSFYPVCNTTLRKGTIQYIIQNGLCYSLDAYQSRTLIARSRNMEFASRKSFWIGLELDENIHTLNGLSFYFDIPLALDKDEYLNLLPYSGWYLNGTPLSLKQGFHMTEKPTGNDIIGIFSRFDVSRNLDESIQSFYNKNFLTVTSGGDIQDDARKVFPESLKEFFPVQLMDDFTQPILWLEVVFPANIKPAVLESLNISINAFPVANKRLRSKIVELDRFLPVILLETGNNEYFISIHSITDSKGREYYELPFDSKDEKEYRTYSLRRGGYERYNKRDALEYLAGLSNTLDSQYASHQGDTSDDDLTEEIQEQVHQLVRQIKKSVAASKDRAEIQNYVHIDQPENNEIFFVKYWTTNCEQANGIKKETCLDCLSADARIDLGSVFTLLPAQGGKSAPQSVEKQNLRMKSLTQGAVIAGSKDIENFCKQHFKDTYQAIEVKKGLMPLDYPAYSFVNTIDVFLTPKSGLEHSFDEEDKQSVKQLLEKNSPATFNYRIFINS